LHHGGEGTLAPGVVRVIQQFQQALGNDLPRIGENLGVKPGGLLALLVEPEAGYDFLVLLICMKCTSTVS